VLFLGRPGTFLKERLDLVERERIDWRPVFAQLADGARGVPREPPAQDRAIEDLAQHVEDDVRPAVRELPTVNSFVVFDRIHVGEPPIRDVERLRALATA